jgi:predicted nucleotidyltransferase
MHVDQVTAFFDSVAEWAQNQPAISGVALVGSHARGEARPDSDIDVVLLCADPQDFLSDTSWIKRFGNVESCQTEDWGMVTSLRVHYRNALEVEFGMTTPEWAELPVDPGTKNVVMNGMRILMDRDGALGRLLETVSAT